MNAANRAVTRAALFQDRQVGCGRRGIAGLIEGNVRQFTARSVGGNMRQGGTVFDSARCSEFITDNGRR
jgi:6-phosphofructokinase 1